MRRFDSQAVPLAWPAPVGSAGPAPEGFGIGLAEAGGPGAGVAVTGAAVGLAVGRTGGEAPIGWPGMGNGAAGFAGFGGNKLMEGKGLFDGAGSGEGVAGVPPVPLLRGPELGSTSLILRTGIGGLSET